TSCPPPSRASPSVSRRSTVRPTPSPPSRHWPPIQRSARASTRSSCPTRAISTRPTRPASRPAASTSAPTCAPARRATAAPPAASEHFGYKLRIVQQGNLGGSGGYSRIMYEARHEERGTTSPFILYMDDDIQIEPDSVLRSLAAARYARSPMLVGGQMLNLQERSHLHTMGEVIDRGSFMWTAAPHTHYDHDFYKHP